MNKKNSKFNFVSLDDTEKEIEEPIREIKITKKDNSKKFEEKSLKEVVEENLKNINTTSHVITNNYNVNKKMYFSFETRVAIRIIIILLLFLISCLLILKTINFGKKEVINYDEITQAHYGVCLNNNNCLQEALTYNSKNTDYINIEFKYSSDYAKKIKHDKAYHVVATTKVYEKNNSTKVLEKDEEVLVERTDLSDISNTIAFESTFDLDYKKYLNKVRELQKKHPNSDASVDVLLFIDDKKSSKDVASISIPFGKDDFTISKKEINELSKKIKIDNNTWNEYNAIYGVIASILIIISLIILYRTTRLVLKVTNNKSEYEIKLAKILKEYDRIIVIAKDGYEPKDGKEIIKVETFSELIEYKDKLSKPIIYSKINDIKSEFIIEDEEKAYRFTLKDNEE